METAKMRKEFWRHSSRGRHPGSSLEEAKTLRYLAIIAVKHKTNSSELLGHIIEAWEKEESRCGPMSLKCREKTEDSAIFLFTIDGEVVAQFSIPIRVLQEKKQLENYVTMISASRDVRVAEPKIEDLKVGMKGVNLKAKVLDIPEPNRVYTRYGTQNYVSNALIEDKTGTIRMSLWNEQINKISKGDTIKVENGNVASFRGELQLRIGRNGNLRVMG